MPLICNADFIKANASFVEIFKARVALKEARGMAYLEGSCPFHSSKSGRSFHVSPANRSWYCFGCQKGGSLADFLMEFENCAYPEALEIMASESGLAVEYGKQERQEDNRPHRQDILGVLECATRHYHSSMTKEAYDYLASRGISASAIERWNLGYARGNSVSAVADEDTLVAAGILKRSDDGRAYDPLAARIIIPITDARGRTIGFTARLMENRPDRPKYLNTGDTPVFQKGKTLFGLAQAKAMLKANSQLAVHVLEGQLKAIACIENGIPAVAPGGTAFTAEQATLLHSLTTNVVWCPDPDEAGHQAVIKAAPIARANGLDMQVGTLVIPDTIEVGIKDPDDLMALGVPVSYEIQSLVSWLYDRVSYKPVANIQEARRVSEEIIPIIMEHPLPAVRLIELKELSELSGIPESQLATPRQNSISRVSNSSETLNRDIDTSMPPERMLYAAILQHGSAENWQQLISWIDLTGQQWSALANIGQVVSLAKSKGISVADAISIAGKPGLREYMRYWLQVPEAATASISALALMIRRDNRRQASMQYASMGNFEYAQFLNN